MKHRVIIVENLVISFNSRVNYMNPRIIFILDIAGTFRKKRKEVRIWRHFAMFLGQTGKSKGL